ncbi:MAG: hypothetical protein Q9167_006239 [Letrouitia subvulpina]
MPQRPAKEQRQWPGPRCDRCERYNYECSANVLKDQPSIAQAEEFEDSYSANVFPHKELQQVADLSNLLSCFNRHIGSNDVVTIQAEDILPTIEDDLRTMIEAVFKAARNFASQGCYKEAEHIYRRCISMSSPKVDARGPCQVFKKEEFLRKVEGLEKIYEELEDHSAMEALQEQKVLFQNSSANSKEITKLANLYVSWLQRLHDTDIVQQSALLLRRATGLDYLPFYDHLFNSLVDYSQIPHDSHSLFVAAEMDAPNLALWTIRTGANIGCKNSLGRTPLIIAAAFGSHKVLQILIDANSSLNEPDNNTFTALHYAAMYGHTECASRLSQVRDTLYFQNRIGHNALHLAVRYHRQDVVKLLLDRGAQVDARTTKTGSTALQLAVSATAPNTATYADNLITKSEIVKLLLMKGSDVNSVDDLGRTVLHKAAGQGYHLTVQVLLHEGAHVSIQDHHGITALHLAVFFGHYHIAELLLESGAHVNSQDIDGQTALRIVAAYESGDYSPNSLAYYSSSGHPMPQFDKKRDYEQEDDMVKAAPRIISGLLKYGADPIIADVDDTSPLTRGMREGREELHKAAAKLYPYIYSEVL